VSTITEPGPFDALAKAEPTEPMFPLLARDPDAPATITEWCRLRRNRAVRDFGDSKRASDKKLLAAELAQCAHAEQVAIEMGEWRSGHDAPVAQRVSHGVQRSEAELAAAASHERLAGIVRHLREAAYQLCEAKDGLAAMGLLPSITEHDVMLALGRINGLADEHTPKRPDFTAPAPGSVAA
jgi:hypothetical protein